MYDFKVCVKDNKLVYVVYVSSPIYSGVLFFKSVEDLFMWYEEARKHFKTDFELAELSWNSVNAMIDEVLEDEHYYIGEHGRTYYK